MSSTAHGDDTSVHEPSWTNQEYEYKLGKGQRIELWAALTLGGGKRRNQ